jgi:hypothetical protein
MSARRSPVVLSLVAAAVLGGSGLMAHDSIDAGGVWLSWNREQQNTYVAGFIVGYSQGFYLACDSADALFEVGQPHPLGKQPSARCLDQIQKYSNLRFTGAATPDYSAYSAVITEFYTKHPKYRDRPFEFLIEQLSDSKHKSVDELYEMAKRGGLRGPR